MDFFKNALYGLADVKGEISKRASQPVYEMRQALARQAQEQEISDAFDRMMELRQKQSYAENNNGPDGPVQFSDTDNMRLYQAMGQAQIDPQKIAANKMAQARLKVFQEAAAGIDNPYAKGNLANKLDVSPTRHASGVTYNRFDPTSNAILDMTEAVRSNGLIKTAEAEIKEAQSKVLVNFLNQSGNNEALKVDAANNKPITKTNKAVYVGKDGKRQEYDQILNPDGSWSYSVAQDEQGQPFTVPADASSTSQITNMNDLISRGVPESKALELVYASKGKTDQQLYEDFYKINLNLFRNPKLAKTNAAEDLKNTRPDSKPPWESVDEINQGGYESASTYKSPEEVKAAYYAGDLGREQALGILRKEFGYQ